MILKQSTAATVVVGPVLDSAGAAVTTATVTNFSLSKNGTVAAFTTETVTHSTNGYYTIALTTDNTDTLGRIEIIVNDSAMSMSTHRYNVIVGTSYDLLVSTGGYSTLDAAGIRTAVGLASANLDTQLSTIDTVVDNIETDTQDIQSRLPAALVSGRIDASVGAMAANTLTASALATDAVDEIVTAVFSYQVTQDQFEILLQNMSAGVIAIETDTQDIQSRLPAALITGRIDASVGKMEADTISASALAADAAGEIADAVWDEPYSGHTTAGTFGKLMDILRKASLTIEGTVSSAITPTTLTFSSNVSATTSAYAHAVLLFVSGPLTGENSPIISYNSTNGVFVLEEVLTAAPSDGDEFVVIAGSHVHSIADIQSGLATSSGVTSAFSEIKGAGWSSSTDTLEKISDAAGTGGGGGTIIQTPIIGIVPERDSQTLLRVYRGETVEQEVTVYEGDGETPIDLSGKTLEIVFEAYLTEDVVVISNANIDVSGDDNNVVTFDYPSTLTATTGKRFWSLRQATSPYTVYLNGEVHILRAAVEDP